MKETPVGDQRSNTIRCTEINFASVKTIYHLTNNCHVTRSPILLT